ncbi:metalloregulator ArsR/SmtB family transcription factor [Caulobacter sp. 17J65-9]|uniref:ArsR/SmtB family transcription factor n=1 Tax=Caulobacter sp. 17J65-9 TaxID=2709382 RepID=UPI0013CC142E|nr:metalloregulator ArsR/SmtB family transcription factor [Caulobacter sp. 17J65-9]NEX91989.1 helix-turn-helix transcriptional regulator [Caulobacter sp. 17J65-9]
MESNIAVAALSALAHPGRLEAFRLLVRAGSEGMAAGDIARATGSLPNTLSANLNVLAGAGLVQSRRDGRSIIYSAAYERMSDLLAFLVEDCCDGRSEICGPVVEKAARPLCGAPSC